jgi:hypothetical protein
MNLLIAILLLLISPQIINAANPNDSLQTDNILSRNEIRLYYSVSLNNVYKDIYLYINAYKCGIETIDWNSFKINLRDITSDSIYNLAKVISKTNLTANCNTLKSDDNDLFLLLFNLEGHHVPSVILNRMELLRLLKAIELNYDYKNLNNDSRQIIDRFYNQLKCE